MKNLYSLLEVDKNADMSAIRRNYLKLSRVKHPDKGGNPEEFKELQTAYEVLSDERSRAMYDQTGQIPGEQPQGPFGMGGQGFPGFPFDIGSMFGMFGERRREGGRPKNVKAPPKKTTLALSLHDFYHGKTMELHLQQSRFCTDCQGEGSKISSVCEQCHGQGAVRQVTQMGPMVFENVVECRHCSGRGKKLGAPCTTCSGSKFVKRDKTLQVLIQKGSNPGDQIILEGESSHVEGFSEPGDVIVELEAAQEDSHSWVRKDQHLTMDITITLKDALCGNIRVLQRHPGFPGGMSVEIPAGIQSHEILRFEGCGMPTTDGRKGDCILTIYITTTAAERAILQGAEEIMSELFGIPLLVKQREGKPLPIWQSAQMT